ncbi:MAG: ParA family protein [Chloroflexia bacterium]|nr:ParA family protein [Chloroflexia bacterium]
MRVIAFANQKGGVGKTTSAVNTSVILAGLGNRVLLIDLDPQGNSTSSLGVDKDELAATTCDVLLDGQTVADAAVRAVRPRLDLLASTPVLAGAEVELVPIAQRERRLKSACERVAGDYDLMIIDCPPSLGLLTVNALTAADSVVIPIQCEFLALEGVSQLITTIDLVKRQLNPELDLLGVLMTMYDARTRLSSHVVAEVRRHFGERMFESIVPRSVRLAEAPSYGQSITEYDAASRGGAAYLAFAAELGARVGLAPRVALS